MIPVFSVSAAVAALAAIAVAERSPRPPIFLLLKPLTTVLIIALALQAPDSTYRSWIVAGLVLSLCGDVFLMFEGTAAFVGGLSSFLIAHVLFMWAFIADLPSLPVPWWTAAFAVYGLTFAFVLMPRAGTLKIPVLVYGLALIGMGITASTRYVALDTQASLLAVIGAGLFLISDSALGVRKFVGGYRGAQALILSTYWTAIGLIAGSCL
jgi:alkenylglycerophosphocholine/alkenylglycerophosphoethanolamine hydrolase